MVLKVRGPVYLSDILLCGLSLLARQANIQRIPGLSFPDLIGGSSLFKEVLDCPVKPDNDDIEVSSCGLIKSRSDGVYVSCSRRGR